jgi:hypothetical protein
MGRRLLALFTAMVGVGACLLALALPGERRAAADPGPEGRFTLLGHEPLLSRGMNSALAIAGHHAYVGSRTDGTHANSGVMVVDIADPRHPRLERQIGPPDEANAGESSRELRVWPGQKLLIVMNIECQAVGHRCPAPQAARGRATFRFYDIAGEHEAKPQLVATYRPARTPHEFFLWQDPRRPDRALLYITTPAYTADVDPEGDQLLVTDISAARDGRFAELASWKPAGLDESPADAQLHSLALDDDGRRAYLAYLGAGVMALDTSDFAAGREHPVPRLLTPPSQRADWGPPGAHSAIPLPGRAAVLTTDEVYGKAFGVGSKLATTPGNTLRGCPWGWSRVLDVADAARPRVVAQYKVLPWNDSERCESVSTDRDNLASFSSHNPTALRDLAIVTWHSAGLQAIDLRDPAHPREAAAWRPQPLAAVADDDPALSSGTEKVVMWSYPIVRDGLIYAVDLRNGLYVVKYAGPGAERLSCVDFREGNSNLGALPRSCAPRLGARAPVDRLRRARLTLTCPAACEGTMRLTRRGRMVAAAPVAVDAHRRTTVVVHLRRPARAVRVRLRGRDRLGDPVEATGLVRLQND